MDTWEGKDLIHTPGVGEREREREIELEYVLGRGF